MDSKLKYLAIFVVIMMIMGSFISPNALSFDPSFKLKISSGCGFMDLSWDNVPGAKGYFIYRGEGSGNQDPSPLEDFPISGVTYHDSIHIYKSKNYCYFVRAVGSDKREFAQSYEVCAEAKCSSTDVRPPNECKLILKFKVGSKTFWVNDAVQPEMTTAPIIKWNKTFLVIKYVAETIGGKVDWDGNTRKVTITARNMVIQMWIGKNTAIINGKNIPIDSNNPDVVPVIENGRTLLPLRFVGNNLGAKEILWDKDTYIAELHFDDPTCDEENPGKGTPGEGGSGGSGDSGSGSGSGPSGSVTDNSSVTPSNPVSSKGSYTPPKGNPTQSEEFDGGLGNSWVPAQGGGGIFDKHVKFVGGEMVVDAPEGSWWGKAGVRSKEPYFIVSDEPYSIVVNVNPTKTNGFVIALSEYGSTEDPWNSQNVWVWYHESPGSVQGAFGLQNVPNDKDVRKTLYDIDNVAPASLTITAKTGYAKVCTSLGYGLEGNFAWLKKGTKVYLYAFASSIDGGGQPVRFALKSIKGYKGDGCSPSTYTPPYGNLVFKEEFDNYNKTMWSPEQGGGGNFDKFAKFEGGAFNVDVPKNSWWGKTGLKSKYYFLEVTQDMAKHPYTIVMNFDPSKTTGFNAAVSDYNGSEDPWNVQNVRIHMCHHEYRTQSLFYMNNSISDKDTIVDNPYMPNILPSQVAFTIWPGKVKITTSQGFTANGNYAWLKPGVKLFLYIHTHPFDDAMPSSMSLKSVQVYRYEGASLPTWNPPTNLLRFSEDFTGGDRNGLWQPVQGGGGDFKKFAKFESGAFVVNVPPNSWWGKTGIRTEHYTFKVTDDMQNHPYQIEFEFDPSRTTGFRVALADVGGSEDPWNVNCIWAGYSLDTKNNKGWFGFSQTPSKNLPGKEVKDLAPGAPSKVTLTVKPGYVKLTNSLGHSFDDSFDFIKKGANLWIYVFSHPYADGMASSMAVKSIKIIR